MQNQPTMQNQSQFVDIYRSMARAAAESSKTVLQNTERLHQQQLQIVRDALERNMKAAAQLAEVKSIDELLAVQSQLIGAQFAHGMETWRAMVRVAGESQATLMAQMQTQAADAASSVASFANAANAGARDHQPQIQVERRPESHRKSA